MTLMEKSNNGYNPPKIRYVATGAPWCEAEKYEHCYAKKNLFIYTVTAYFCSSINTGIQVKSVGSAGAE